MHDSTRIYAEVTHVKRVKGGYMLRPGWAYVKNAFGVQPWVVITPENVLGNTCDNKSLKETVVSVMSLPPEE